MTLVAAYYEHGDTVLFGDLLVTSPAKQDTLHHIPSLGFTDNLYNEDPNSHNAGLARKLHLFSGQLAVGCAGNAIAAITAYKDIAENFSTEYCTRQYFFDYFAQLDFIGSLDLTLVGIFTDFEGTFTFKWHSLNPKQLNIQGDYFEGSGKYYLKGRYTLLPSDTEDDCLNNEPAFIKALSKCVLLLGDEHIVGDPLQSYFGGGFELIVHHDGRLKFVTDFAIVPWLINYKDGEICELIFSNKIIQQTYRDDILWICASVYRSKEADQRYDNEWRTELYALPPIHGRQSKNTFQKLELKDFDSKTICNYFYVNDLNSNKVLTFVDIYPPANEFYTFTSNKDGVNITFENHYISVLTELIKKSVSNQVFMGN